MTVSELGERALLARIRARLPEPGNDVVVGIGDDAAVVTSARNARVVLTTDALIEGVHFDRSVSSAGDIGYKALAVNLSDLAAMGASPAWALLSLALPDDTQVEYVEALTDGVVTLASAEHTALVGGNLTRSPGPLVVDITAIGTVHPRRVLTRGGGRSGDELYVSGEIGAGSAGLELLRGNGRHPHPPSAAACIDRYRRPAPRLRLARVVAQAQAARAAIDLSDGLADAVRQVAEASGCGAELDAAALPIASGARNWWTLNEIDPVTRALSGGDDYELLFAIPPKWGGRLRHARRQAATTPLTKIGVLTKTPGDFVVLREGRRERLPGGFEHW